MNWLRRASLRAAAASGSAASAEPTSNNGPKTSFIARNAAAMPLLERRKPRRPRPSRRPWVSAISSSRASTCRCAGLCGNGLNSPFETICVGTGEWNAALSAGARPASSRPLKKLPIGFPPQIRDEQADDCRHVPVWPERDPRGLELLRHGSLDRRTLHLMWHLRQG